MTKEEIIANIDGSINGERNPKISGDILHTVLRNMLDYGFTHQNTLFVDPNGDNGTAQEGRADLPWSDTSTALMYLATNNKEDYTIIVFPGIYNEEQHWLFCNDQTQSEAPFNNNNNTTIRLLGNVEIYSIDNSIILDNTNSNQVSLNVSIIGDARGNTTRLFGANASIKTSNGDNIQYVSSATNPSDASPINLNIENVSVRCGYNDYDAGPVGGSNPCNISFSGYITGKLSLQNVTMRNFIRSNWGVMYGASLAVWDANVYMNNTYWEAGSNGRYPNWEFPLDDLFGTKVYFYIENTKFSNTGYYSVGKDFHISTASYDSNRRYNMMMSNVVFFSVNGNNYMWYNNIIGGSHGVNLDLLGAVVTNKRIVLGVSIISALQPVMDSNMLDITKFQD